jgi:hypothetical protein
MEMNRDQLLEKANKHGLKPVKKDNPVSSLKAMRKELEDYFDTPEGREALARAPKSMLATVDGDDHVMMHETTKELAVKLLLSEFGGDG